MRGTTILFLAVGVLHLAGCGGGGDDPVVDSAADPVVTASFVHTATALNTVDDITYMDHALTTGNPQAVLIVTPNWNPVASGPMIWFDHVYAVLYSAALGQWGIITADGADVPEAASFNVTVAAGESTGAVVFFRHTALGATIDGAVSRIDHVRANNQPDALLLCTRNLTPAGGVAPGDGLSFGVAYRLADSQWALHNHDGTPIQVGSAFNIAVLPVGGGGPFADAWTHRSTLADTEFNYTYVGALPRGTILHAMPFLCAFRGYDTPHGEHVTGVWFNDGGREEWGVFNQDTDDMAVGAAFHVAIAVP